MLNLPPQLPPSLLAKAPAEIKFVNLDSKEEKVAGNLAQRITIPIKRSVAEKATINGINNKILVIQTGDPRNYPNNVTTLTARSSQNGIFQVYKDEDIATKRRNPNFELMPVGWINPQGKLISTQGGGEIALTNVNALIRGLQNPNPRKDLEKLSSDFGATREQR